MIHATALPHGAQHLPSTPAQARPDPTRIAAISGAIALNVAVMLALLRPVDLPLPSLKDLGDRIVVQWIEPVPVVPPPPLPPQIIPDTPQPPAPATRTPIPPTPVAPTSSEQARPMDIVVEPAPPATPTFNEPITATPTTPLAGPLTGAALAMREAPRPTYPREALRDGREGVVQLLVMVDRNGNPTDVRIQRSSGHRDLDQAARQQVLRRWRFHPAMHEGRAVDASGLVEVAFTLQ